MVQHGSTVLVPIENRPYGKREGRVQDPFGAPLDHQRRPALSEPARRYGAVDSTCLN
ncbi:hypothetical protein [Jatrophihabitans lederbergiae]|uniref:hypothetical protein n=1 Tax=Jatrophihabitans lederbergiae TaxID=3075547 RepID=UPI0037C10636